MTENHATPREHSTNRRRFVTAVGAAGAAGLAGCIGGGTKTGGGGGGSGGKIVFGQPAILSGGIQFIQPPVSASADIAANMINEAGGPLGRKINIKRRDTAYKPPKARQTLQQFINNDNAVVINGLTSTTLVPNWEFLQKQKTPVVTMYAGTPFLDNKGGDHMTPEKLGDDGWVWRTTGADSQHTAAAALHAKDAGATNIGVINTKTAGARTWAGAFYKAVEAIDGMNQTKRLEVEGGKTTYRSDLERFFEADIDLFAVAVEEAPDAVTMLQQWKEGPYGGKVMLSNPMKNSKVRKELGEPLKDEWVRVSVPAIAGPYADTYFNKFDSFVKDSNKYKNDISVNNWSASAYDSIMVSALAIQSAGKADPKAIEKKLGTVARPPGKKVSTFAAGKQALENGEDINYVGAQTKVDFNKFGDVFNTAQIFELAPNEWKKRTKIGAERIEKVIAAKRKM